MVLLNLNMITTGWTIFVDTLKYYLVTVILCKLGTTKENCKIFTTKQKKHFWITISESVCSAFGTLWYGTENENKKNTYTADLALVVVMRLASITLTIIDQHNVPKYFITDDIYHDSI